MDLGSEDLRSLGQEILTMGLNFALVPKISPAGHHSRATTKRWCWWPPKSSVLNLGECPDTQRQHDDEIALKGVHESRGCGDSTSRREMVIKKSDYERMMRGILDDTRSYAKTPPPPIRYFTPGWEDPFTFWISVINVWRWTRPWLASMSPRCSPTPYR